MDIETAQLATRGWGKADHLIHTSQSEFSPEKVAQVGILDDVNWGALGGPSPARRGCREGRREQGRRGKPLGFVMASLSLLLVLYGHLAALPGRLEMLDLSETPPLFCFSWPEWVSVTWGRGGGEVGKGFPEKGA